MRPMLLAPFVAALLCAAITIWLPRRWLLIWLPLLWVGSTLAYDRTAALYPPHDLSAGLIFLPFYVINVPTTLVRLIFVIAYLNRRWGPGYSDTD